MNLIARIYAAFVRIPFPWQVREITSRGVNGLFGLRERRPVSVERVIINSLRQDGFCVVGQLEEKDTEFLRSFICRHVSAQEELSEDVPGQSMVSTGMFYVPESILCSNAKLVNIVTEYRLKDIADAYLRTGTRLISIAAWITRPTEHMKPVNAQLFHRDFDTIKWLKFFIYLSDVDSERGPHVFVPGSHRINKFMRFRRISNAEASSAGLLGREIVGRRGTIIAVDTFGLHRGSAVKVDERVMLQFNLSSLPEAFKVYPSTTLHGHPLLEFYKVN